MNATPWLRRIVGAMHPRIRLVCCPHAGGGASFFMPWRSSLLPEIELVAVQYPGRETRRTEPLVADISAMADAVANDLTSLDRAPIAMFGHSMGALVAYEVALRLGPAVAALMPSAREPGARPGKRHLLDDESLWAEVRRLDGVPRELLGSAELRALSLPILRSDFRAAETYEERAHPMLGCWIDAFVATSDSAASVDGMRGWAARTTGMFRLHVFEGGHFYLSKSPARTVAFVAECLAMVAT